MNRNGPWRDAALLAAAILVAAPAAAQTPADRQADLPTSLAEAVIELFNHPETVRLTGEARIAPGSEVVGDVAVLNGPFSLAGRIRGRLVVINGDARLESGAELLGDLTVIGGAVLGLDSATVTGSVVSYREALRFRLEGGRMAMAAPVPEPGISAGREWFFGRADVTLKTRRGYNRVEGLPVVVGPRFETRSANATRGEALLIYRTISKFDVDAGALGHLVTLEQYLGGRRVVRLGVAHRSEIEPIEDWGLSDRENSLSAFVIGRDYRDHYEREGWSAHLGLAPRGRPFELMLEYRDETHRAIAAGEPWVLLGDGAWRRQPMIAEGRLRSIVARAGYDTRNENGDPSSGWLVRLEAERGIGGSLRHPASAAAAEIAAAEAFAIGSLDLRRYARLGPSSTLAVRVLAAGSLQDDVPLPPQRQHALGGEGSLPGYRAFRFDCNARDETAAYEGRGEFFPYYGCDRVALVQLEYQSSFPFGRGWGRLDGDLDLGESPSWVVFFDAGRAWNERTARAGRGGGQDDFSADAGLGVRLGRVGAYWAVPLSGSDKGINFFVRIGSRL